MFFGYQRHDSTQRDLRIQVFDWKGRLQRPAFSNPLTARCGFGDHAAAFCYSFGLFVFIMCCYHCCWFCYLCVGCFNMRPLFESGGLRAERGLSEPLLPARPWPRPVFDLYFELGKGGPREGSSGIFQNDPPLLGTPLPESGRSPGRPIVCPGAEEGGDGNAQQTAQPGGSPKRPPTRGRESVSGRPACKINEQNNTYIYIDIYICLPIHI